MRQCNPHHPERIYRRSCNYLIWSFRSNSGHYKERPTSSKDIVLKILTQVDCGIRIRTIMTAIVASDVVRITLLNGLMDDRNTDSRSKSIRADGTAHVNASLIRRSRRWLLFVIYEMIGQQLMLIASRGLLRNILVEVTAQHESIHFAVSPFSMACIGYHACEVLCGPIKILCFFYFRLTQSSDASSAVRWGSPNNSAAEIFQPKREWTLRQKQRWLSLWILAATIYRTIKFYCSSM